MTKIKTVKEVKAPKKEKVVKKEVKKEYFMEVNVNDLEFKTTGVDIRECLSNFVSDKEFPRGAKTRLFIVYGNKDKTRNRVYHIAIARRLLMTLKNKQSTFDILVNNLNRDLA